MSHTPTTLDDFDVAAVKYRNQRYFGSLDAIRALAILAVIWHHTAEPTSWLPLSGRGYLGVDLFFVLSGFLIVTLLLREEDRDGAINLKAFYARRSLRIFPLYYAALVAMFAITKVTSGETTQAFTSEWYYHAFYLSNWTEMASFMAISWSLASEEQFYLVWPPIQRFFGRLILPTFLVLLVVNQMVNFGWIWEAKRAAGWTLGDATFTPILLGVGAAYLLHHRYVLLAPILKWRGTAPGLALSILIVANAPSEIPGIVGIHRLTLHILMTLLIIAVAGNENNGLARSLNRQPLVRFGAISYGMYLIHVFVIAIGDQFLGSLSWWNTSFGKFIITLTLTVAAAEVSFRFFETPILKQKARLQAFVSHDSTPTPPPPPTADTRVSA